MDQDEIFNLLNKGAEQLDLSLTKEQAHSFYLYLQELKAWGKIMNLTRRSDDREIVIKDFLDSLSVQKQISPGAFLLDLGSGAGFPGVPLKIVRQDLTVVLLEIILKRINFLKYIVRILALEGVEVHRAEQKNGVEQRFLGECDFVIARAFGPLIKLAEAGLPFLRKGGMLLAMKGPKGEDELETNLNVLKRMDLRVILLSRFRLPLLGHERTLIGLQRD